jgi:hypothetical protein
LYGDGYYNERTVLYFCRKPPKRPESMKFEVLTALNIKIAAFWDVTLCSFVDGYQTFQRNLPPQSSGSDLKMELEVSSKIFVPIYQITRCHIPEDPNLKA